MSAHATQLPRGADELLNRLLTAQGHLQAVSVMVAEAAPPEDILHQLCAVQAAISAAGRLILLRELRAGADAMLQSQSSDQRALEADRLVKLFSLAAERLLETTGRPNDRS